MARADSIDIDEEFDLKVAEMELLARKGVSLG